MDASDQFPLNLRALSGEILIKLVAPLPQFAFDAGNEKCILFQPSAKSNAHWILTFLSHLRLLDESVSNVMKNIAINKRPQYNGQKYQTIEERVDFYAADEERRVYDFADPKCILFILIQYGHVYYNTHIAHNTAVNTKWTSSEQFVAACRHLETMAPSSNTASTSSIDTDATLTAMDSCRALLLCIPNRPPAVLSALGELQTFEQHCVTSSWRASMVINNVIPITFPFDYDDGSSGVYHAGTNVLFYQLSEDLQGVVKECARRTAYHGTTATLSVGIGEGRASSVQSDMSISGWRTAGAKKTKARDSPAASASAARHGKGGKKHTAQTQKIDRRPTTDSQDSISSLSPLTNKKGRGNAASGVGRKNSGDPPPPGLPQPSHRPVKNADNSHPRDTRDWKGKGGVQIGTAPPAALVVDFRDAWKDTPPNGSGSSASTAVAAPPPLVVDFRDAWKDTPAPTASKATAVQSVTTPISTPPVIVDFRDAWKTT